MLKGVLLAAIDGHLVVAAHTGVYKLNVDVAADAIDITIVPVLEGIRGGFAAAFIHGALVHTAAGVGFLTIGRAKLDVDHAAVGELPGLARGEMFVGIGDAAVVLFAVGVFRRIGIWIAAAPELLNEGVALLVVAQALEGLPFLVADDPANILIQPLFVGAVQFLAEFLLLLEALLVGKLAGEGILVLAALGVLGSVASLRGMARRAGVCTGNGNNRAEGDRENQGETTGRHAAFDCSYTA